MISPQNWLVIQLALYTIAIVVAHKIF